MLYFFIFFFFKQKTAYEMRISDWSSDVCSSDLCRGRCQRSPPHAPRRGGGSRRGARRVRTGRRPWICSMAGQPAGNPGAAPRRAPGPQGCPLPCRSSHRSEEHTSELQSLMRISYDVLCLKKKKYRTSINPSQSHRNLVYHQLINRPIYHQTTHITVTR